MAEYKEALENLGLGSKETGVYMALLELGEATVQEVSKKAGLKRPTVYTLLRPLEEKGFISRVVRGKKVFFSPQHPRKLITEAELHLKELQEVVPQLESLFHRESGRPRIMIYEGGGALDRAYDEWFLMKGEQLYMGTLQLSQGALPRTFKKMEYITFGSDFRIRELLAESEEARTYARKVEKPYREVRFIPKELLPFEIDIGMFGNRVLITSVKKEYFTISLESEEIARAFRTIFEVMWGAGKK